MKRTLFFSLFITLSSNFIFGENPNSVYTQLVQLNKYWECFEGNDPMLNENKTFDDWEELIQLHLQLIEKQLRQKDIRHLSLEQQQKRLHGLDILNAYWKAKKFPQNTHHSGQVIPYFIDDFNTACAVGHVLRETGGTALAERIKHGNNYAYLEDMDYVELLEWGKEYGFEEEELRWIQPSYSSPCFPQEALPYEEDFEGYSMSSSFSNQHGCWFTWSGQSGSIEEPTISNNQALSGTQSLRVQNQNDIVLDLGNRTSGKFQIKFDLHIPNGKNAYYNILHQFNPDNINTNEEWAYEVFFYPDKTGEIKVNRTTVQNFSFESPFLFIVQDIDIDNDLIKLYIDNTKIYEQKFTSPEFDASDGSQKLAGLNFYGANSNHDFYVNDLGVYDIDLPSCTGNVLNKSWLQNLISNCQPCTSFSTFDWNGRKVVSRNYNSFDCGIADGSNGTYYDCDGKELGSYLESLGGGEYGVSFNDVSNVTTIHECSACEKIENLTVEEVGTNHLILDWTPYFSTEDDSYTLEWREGNSGAWSSADLFPTFLSQNHLSVGAGNFSFESCESAVCFVILPVPDDPVPRIIINGLEACTAYEFRVKKNCKSGEITNFSSILSIATGDCNNSYNRSCMSASLNNFQGGASLGYVYKSYISSVFIDNFEDQIIDCSDAENCNGCDFLTNDGYLYRSDKKLTLIAGKETDLSFFIGPSTIADVGMVKYNSGYLKIWIDLNGDLDFEDSGEEIYSSGNVESRTLNRGVFTVPNLSVSDNKRMRIVYRHDAIPEPCGVYCTGITLDYDVSIEKINDCVARDKEVLIALYDATNGDNWTNNTNWKSNKPLGEWYGVTTNEEGCLSKLELTSNNLIGGIPKEIGKLQELETVSLNKNQLVGNIPIEIGTLSSLTFISLDNNQLGNAIPKELGNLMKLTQIDFGNNNLAGNIPKELGHLKKLTRLDLFDNQLTGIIPKELGQLTNLNRILLFNNQLSGCFPEEIMTFCGITVDFSENIGLPWNGDFSRFCNNESQIGAPCDDGDPSTQNDQITEDCECKGTNANLPPWQKVPCVGAPNLQAVHLDRSNGRITGRIDFMDLAEGDYIGIFYINEKGDSICQDYVAYPADGESIFLNICEDVAATPEKDGFAIGEELIYRVTSVAL